MPRSTPAPPEPEGQAAPKVETETDRKRRAIERGVYERRTVTDKSAEAELERHRKEGKSSPPEGS